MIDRLRIDAGATLQQQACSFRLSGGHSQQQGCLTAAVDSIDRRAALKCRGDRLGVATGRSLVQTLGRNRLCHHHLRKEKR